MWVCEGEGEGAQEEAGAVGSGDRVHQAVEAALKDDVIMT